ncbi:hypothetical protein [Aquimarina sediminis]|uniref:hypothetical protein n=1 Tax=Aquimarina sediminis TaxID=2070536 RepID=UPI000CA0803A|nr:hypothetical protein [Aquimarina sediminis]
MELLLDFILVGGVVITLLILMLLFKEKHKQLPRKLLIVLFVLLLLVCLENYAFLHKLRWLLIVPFVPSEAVIWLVAPLLLFYIQSLIKPTSFDWVKRFFLHFYRQYATLHLLCFRYGYH